ncbi:molybdopterin molybdotransferase MoeA [Aeromicrobium sp.]|uniref:molybdopterin molybdotransferase MoeA n=1 Tax=Aeromicrobium sp. TaxID=1871063 RepID=UPI0028ACC4A6|nr:molybdopterin molybdotransferase MoeA [Aeromicrobium sp.]
MSDLPWAAARERARTACAPGPVALVAVNDALGDTTASDLLALGPVPHAATSAMDGWVVAGEGPWKLDAGSGPLPDGHARVIVTGGVPPEGADSVLPVEHGDVSGDRLSGPTPPPGRHIRPAGEEARTGDVIVAGGRVLTPARLAVLATTGHDEVPVRRAPRVLLLVTGDELDSTGIPAVGRVRDVMTPMLPPMLERLGARVVRVERVRDDASDVAEAAELEESDLVVSAGGTGRSAADPIGSAWEKLRADVRFRGVDMRPGHPASLAVLPDGRPWLALPGNPLAAVVTALSFVPALVAGHTGAPLPEASVATAGASFSGRAGTTLVPAEHGPEGLVPATTSRPHMLRGLAEADVVAIVPAGGVEPGQAVAVLPRVW